MNEKIAFIGDVHGKLDKYVKLTDLARDRGYEETVQVGDLGVGFRVSEEIKTYRPPMFMKTGDRFIRGNHDNPNICMSTTSKHYIQDGYHDPERDIFYVGGALSIDKRFRMEGVNWWPNEELSYGEMQYVVDRYLSIRPRVMVTHDCPEEAAVRMFPFYNREYPSLTRQAFQYMLDEHHPCLWVFGHWHRDAVYQYGPYPCDSTLFVCLDELSAVGIDLSNLSMENLAFKPLYH